MNAPLPPDAVAVATLPVAAIYPSPSNPRKHFDEAYIAELAESIKNHGLIQPITVRPMPLEHLLDYNRKHHDRTDASAIPTYEIVVGECRWRAAKLAGLIEIPGFWRELDDKQVLEIQVVENLQRRDVHELEEADGYRLLMERHGYTADQIAEKIGKSRAYVYARLKLTALCEDGREAFFAGLLDASTALLVARIRGDALQKKAVKALTTEGIDGRPKSYRDAKYYIRNQFTISLKQATFKPDDAMLVPTAGACSACPQRSGNDPEIFADIDEDDICTDTKCFEAKRQARQAQLLAHAQQHKLPVFTGEATKAIMPNGYLWSLNHDRYVTLDDRPAGDPEDRTYREILGDTAPVAALIECGPTNDKKLIELAEPNAIEAALKKAGWEPVEDAAATAARQNREESRARQAAAEAKREENAKAGQAENEWRNRLAEHLFPTIQRTANAGDLLLCTDDAIVLLAQAWLRHELEYTYELNEAALERWGNITVPSEYDIDDLLPTIIERMTKWPVGTALAYLFDSLSEHERQINPSGFEPGTSRPDTLLALAKRVGIDPESLRNPAETVPTPCQAAQAQENTAATAAPAKTKAPKKTKAKADPAPATPANEPAAPVKTLEPWPFPTGARV